MFLINQPVVANDYQPTQTYSLDQITGIIQSLQTNLPKVTILPDSPLYFIKTLYEEFRIYIAHTTQEKVELLYLYSRQRLAETLQLLLQDKIAKATESLNQYSLFNTRITDLTKVTNQISLPNQISIPNFDVTEVQSQLLKTLTSEYNSSWRK